MWKIRIYKKLQMLTEKLYRMADWKPMAVLAIYITLKEK
jgi:hypothetical protein